MKATDARTREMLGEPVRLPKAADVIAGRLRSQIIRGELREGQELPPEQELLRVLGVGRPALREALRILESEALIRVRRGSKGGATVHFPNRAVAARSAGLLLQAERTTLADVYQTRIIIEPAAAQLLGNNATTGAKQELAQLLNEEAAVLGDPAAYALASARFHERLVALAGLKTLALVSDLLSDITDRFTAHAMATTSHGHKSVLAGIRRSHRAHQRLTELVDAHDGAGAEALWRKHMVVAGQLLLEDGRGDEVIDLLS
jgi:GntR family transcriptional repressor for pyruvate dehydrogenase complex